MPRILVVDDDHDVRETICATLAFFGHDCLVAADGVEALERLRAPDAPEVVLVDLMMPGMDGAEFLSRVADDPRLCRGRRYVVITARNLLTPREADAIGRLHVAVLHKPFDLDVLAGAIAEALDALLPEEGARGA